MNDEKHTHQQVILVLSDDERRFGVELPVWMNEKPSRIFVKRFLGEFEHPLDVIRQIRVF